MSGPQHPHIKPHLLILSIVPPKHILTFQHFNLSTDPDGQNNSTPCHPTAPVKKSATSPLAVCLPLSPLFPRGLPFPLPSFPIPYPFNLVHRPPFDDLTFPNRQPTAAPTLENISLTRALRSRRRLQHLRVRGTHQVRPHIAQ
jgi:hypothetical protein